ncbi:MAG: hotdog domain-containing protein [Fidelibacterota bacterium]
MNTIGSLFGGKMISWMDIAATKAGQRFLRSTGAMGGVTKAIDKVVFSEPVYGGEWVNIKATVISVGTTFPPGYRY